MATCSAEIRRRSKLGIRRLRPTVADDSTYAHEGPAGGLQGARSKENGAARVSLPKLLGRRSTGPSTAPYVSQIKPDVETGLFAASPGHHGLRSQGSTGRFGFKADPGVRPTHLRRTEGRVRNMGRNEAARGVFRRAGTRRAARYARGKQGSWQGGPREYKGVPGFLHAALVAGHVLESALKRSKGPLERQAGLVAGRAATTAPGEAQADRGARSASTSTASQSSTIYVAQVLSGQGRRLGETPSFATFPEGTQFLGAFDGQVHRPRRGYSRDLPFPHRNLE